MNQCHLVKKLFPCEVRTLSGVEGYLLNQTTLDYEYKKGGNKMLKIINKQ